MSNKISFLIDLNNKQAIQNINQIKTECEKIPQTTNKFWDNQKLWANTFKIGGAGLALKAITSAFSTLQTLATPALNALKTGFQEITQDENMTVLLAQFTKCQDAAATLQGNLDNLAANGVVAIDDLAKAASKLSLHFGKNTSATTEWTRIFADIAASGITTADTLANAFSKVMANGYADSRALNTLQNIGIPIIKALADELDTASYKVIELAKNKQISADTYCAAVRRMHAEEFDGLNSALSSTLSGSWDTLLATATNALGTITAHTLNTISALTGTKSILNDIIGIFDNIANNNFNPFTTANPFLAGKLHPEWASKNATLTPDALLAPITTATTEEEIKAVKTHLDTLYKELQTQFFALDYAEKNNLFDPTTLEQTLTNLKAIDATLTQTYRTYYKFTDKNGTINNLTKTALLTANKEAAEQERTLHRAAEKIPTIINRTLTTAGLNRNTYQTRLNSDLASLGLPEITTLEAYFHTLDSLKIKYTQGGITALTNDEVKTLAKLGETENHFREMLRIRDSLAGLTKKEIDANSTAITQAKNELTLLNAILSGDEKHITNLKKQADIEAKKAQLIRSGMNAQSAASYASAIIGAKYDIEEKKRKDADAKKNRQEATTFLNSTLDRTFAAIRQTLTSTGHLGNGFSSGLNLSASPATIASAITALTAETKTANKHLQTIATWTTKNPSISPSGTPRFL